MSIKQSKLQLDLHDQLHFICIEKFHIFIKRIYESDLSLESLEDLITITVKTNKITDSALEIKFAFEKSVLHHLNFLNLKSDLDSLLEATTSFNEILAKLDKFDKLLLNYIHIPSIFVSICIPPLIDEMSIFSESSRPDNTAKSLEIYRSIKLLHKKVDSINYKIAKEFKIKEWFTKLVSEWLINTRNLVSSWTVGCVRVDTWKPHLNNTSTSLFDLFNSFSQTIEFWIKLEWPDDHLFELFEIFENACFSYLDLITFDFQVSEPKLNVVDKIIKKTSAEFKNNQVIDEKVSLS